MKDEIQKEHIPMLIDTGFSLSANDNSIRLARCWNILRTMTDAQLVSLEKQVDAVAAEVGEEFVCVHIGPSLPF